MIKKVYFRFPWLSSLLVIALFISSCSGGATSEGQATESSPPAPTEEVVSTPTHEDEHGTTVADNGVLYHDDFTNPATGWPEEKFDNFFIGYHEPEYYHVEITSPNYKTTVFEPGKQSYGDVTIEVKAFSALSRTSETGDFTFGPVFRRSGDQYYAFVLSQRAKKWYVLKSSPTALTVLTEGSDEGIHDPDVEDVLRVDAQGASFTFSINDQVVGQVTDADYASGEVGFFVQSFDVPAVHVHFDELTIKPLILAVACKVRAQALRVRSGPGTDYSSSVYLRAGETVQPMGLSADGEWLLISVDADNNKGWIFSSAEFLTCNEALDGLPIVTP